jgi:ATP-dependent DNA helicase RecG
MQTGAGQHANGYWRGGIAGTQPGYYADDMPNEVSGSSLQTPMRFVKGVGESRAALLANLGINTVEDLLLTLPFRYEDRREVKPFSELQPGTAPVTARGQIIASGWVARPGGGYFEAVLRDPSGGIARCRWYNSAYLQHQLRIGEELIVCGKVSRFKNLLVFQHPEYERAGDNETDDSLHMGRIVPFYHLTEQLSQRIMRRIMWNALESFSGAVEEILPEETRERNRLMPLPTAIREVHFPSAMERAQEARYRLVFEEFLCTQIVLVARKLHTEQFLEGHVHAPAGRLRRQFIEKLPFKLTGAQERVLREIETDMRKPRPMHRLLQGDVGSGKTMVGMCAMLDAVESGSQCALLAPTEILAEQHHQTLRRYLEPHGVRIELLTHAVNGAVREELLERIQAGAVDIVVGTHAILEDRVAFKKLGFIVIDEQHKFGVAQRGMLYEKGQQPDVLVMTATPIPRTLAMTIYGDLDVSWLDEMPEGRGTVVTKVIGREQLPKAYAFIRRQIAKGRQAFLIYPVIEESRVADLQAAKDLFETLRGGALLGLRMALIHGQMPAQDKNSIMEQFRRGEVSVLVASSVVEVGIDIPNANVMLVGNAERFGLSQLHQLRGRIGRGPHKSFCILQANPTTPEAWQRLKVMEQTTDGFRIAEEDLRIRGMGNLLGREQSGVMPLRVADPLRDGDALWAAREEAFAIVNKDARLESPAMAALRERARSLYKVAGPFVRVG